MNTDSHRENHGKFQAGNKARQAIIKQRTANVSLRTSLRSAIKKVQKSIVAADHTVARAALKAEQATIDAMAGKRIIHKNKAARHKSRLAAQVKALGAPRT